MEVERGYVRFQGFWNYAYFSSKECQGLPWNIGDSNEEEKGRVFYSFDSELVKKRQNFLCQGLGCEIVWVKDI